MADLLKLKASQKGTTWHNKLKDNLCGQKIDKTILPHVLLNTTGLPVTSSMGNCFFDENTQAYEIFVDESRDNATGECGYGIWFGYKNPNNKNYKVYGNNSLQNAHCKIINPVVGLL